MQRPVFSQSLIQCNTRGPYYCALLCLGNPLALVADWYRAGLAFSRFGGRGGGTLLLSGYCLELDKQIRSTKKIAKLCQPFGAVVGGGDVCAM